MNLHFTVGKIGSRSRLTSNIIFFFSNDVMRTEATAKLYAALLTRPFFSKAVKESLSEAEQPWQKQVVFKCNVSLAHTTSGLSHKAGPFTKVWQFDWQSWLNYFLWYTHSSGTNGKQNFVWHIYPVSLFLTLPFHLTWISRQQADIKSICVWVCVKRKRKSICHGWRPPSLTSLNLSCLKHSWAIQNR